MAGRSQNPLLKQALSYHNRGWSIIPVRAGTKRPAVRSWKQYQQTRPDTAKLRKWFSNGGKSIAVILGEVSNGLACRDFDTPAEYENWAGAHPDLAGLLPTVRTANGYHVYFEGHIEGIKHISNGELRGSGGYCLLPPSVHPDGQIYQWVNPLLNGNLLAVDPELAGFITPQDNVTEHTEHTEHTEQIEHTEAIISCEFVEKAIKRTLPKTFGTRNRKLFDFAKALRTEYPSADSKAFRKAVRKWYDLALPHIRTKDFAETWLDFLVAWDNVKYFEGVNPMVIYEQAIKLKPPQTVAINYPDNPKIQNLAVLCREMQKACGDNPFFLSARTAAGLLEISAMQANRYLRLLVKEEILTISEKGGTSQNPRKATRFRYVAN